MSSLCVSRSCSHVLHYFQSLSSQSEISYQNFFCLCMDFSPAFASMCSILSREERREEGRGWQGREAAEFQTHGLCAVQPDKSIGPCLGILIRSAWFTAVAKCYRAGDGIFFRGTIDCSSLSSEKRFQLCRLHHGGSWWRSAPLQLYRIRIDSLISLWTGKLSF